MTDTPQTTDTPPAAAPEVKAPESQATPAPTAAPEPSPAPTPAPTQAPTPDKPKAAAAKTVLDTTADDDKPAAAPADWPDDWREKLSGSDAKMLATLKRYASPKAFNDAYFAMKQKLSSGEFQKALPADATEEQVAEWRKENGIPEKPEGYDTTLADGLVIGEQDKALVGEFLTAMHATNATPAAVKAALSTYYKLVEKQQADQADADAAYRVETEDGLRAQWGNDFRRNLTTVHALLDATAPAGFKDRLMGARLADGKRLGDDAAALTFLANLASEINPAATVVPGMSGNAAGAIADELANLQKMMGDRGSEYWRGPSAEKHQARYRELLTAQEKLAKRA